MIYLFFSKFCCAEFNKLETISNPLFMAIKFFSKNTIYDVMLSIFYSSLSGTVFLCFMSCYCLYTSFSSVTISLDKSLVSSIYYAILIKPFACYLTSSFIRAYNLSLRFNIYFVFSTSSPFILMAFTFPNLSLKSSPLSFMNTSSFTI